MRRRSDDAHFESKKAQLAKQEKARSYFSRTKLNKVQLEAFLNNPNVQHITYDHGEEIHSRGPSRFELQNMAVLNFHNVK